MVPGPVPPQLQNLRLLEKQLIALAHPIARVVRLKGGGQYGYSGHILNVARDVTTFATSLPWNADSNDVPIVIIVPPQGGNWDGQEFEVSRLAVENALLWLIANHPAYAGVALDLARLDALGPPGDNTRRDMRSRFYTIRENGDGNTSDSSVEPGEESGRREYRGVGAPGPDESDSEVTDPIDASGRGARGTRAPRESFIPDDDIDGVGEEDNLRQALQRLAAGRQEDNDGGEGPPRVDQPRQLGPLPEHRTPYLASKCFPWLFPYGKADPFWGARQRDVSFADHVKHLMKFADVDGEGNFHYRFASDRLFRYWCLDMKMRRQAREQCRMYLRHNPQRAQMTVEELSENIRDNVRGIIGQMTRYSANVAGSDGYWLSQQEKLENAVEQLPSLTVFTTYSAADHHWFDLHRLMPGFREGSPPDIQQRNRALIENPHLADWWFWERLRLWKGVYLGPEMADQRWFWDRAEWQSRASLHVHGCSSWGCEPDGRMTDLSRTFLKGFLARRTENEDVPDAHSASDGQAEPRDGGVSDEEYERVQREMCTFLVGVGFTARNPSPPGDDIPVSEEARNEGLKELARDMRDFDWEDEDAARDRYAMLVNVTQRHTRCGSYCLRGGKCRFGYPHARQDRIEITAHPLVHPPTNRIEDWQVVVLPPRSSPAQEGEEGEGEHDGYVNRHVIVQILGWGGNVDSSFIVDRGMAYRYMVKYASKGESRSREAQRLLTEMIDDASRQPADERPSMPRMLVSAMMRCTTRRDMGAQEVQHLNLQTDSVDHNLAFARASTENDQVEVLPGPDGRPDFRRDLLTAYSDRLDARTWAPHAMILNDALSRMSYAEFAMQFYVRRDKKLGRIRSRQNRVVTFRPWCSSNPQGDGYPDYCRNSLVRFRAWEGGFANGWGGAEGDIARAEDVVKRQAMVNTWVAFANETLQVPYSLRPPGFSALDLRPVIRRPPRRRRRRIDAQSEGSGSDSDSESREGDEDEPNLDGVYGGAGTRTGDLSDNRRWEDSADHDWGSNGWVGQAGVPEGARTWVKEMKRSGQDGLASGPTSAGPPLNTKQAHAVDIVRQHDLQLAAYRQQRDGPEDVLPGEGINAPEPLRMLMAGTAGTGKTVVINEMVRVIGPEKFKLLAPTGNAACGIGGQVRFNTMPTLPSRNVIISVVAVMYTFMLSLHFAFDQPFQLFSCDHYNQHIQSAFIFVPFPFSPIRLFTAASRYLSKRGLEQAQMAVGSNRAP